MKKTRKVGRTRKLSILYKMLMATSAIMVAVAVLISVIACNQVESRLVDAAVEAAGTAGNVVVGDNANKDIAQDLNNEVNKFKLS